MCIYQKVLFILDTLIIWSDQLNNKILPKIKKGSYVFKKKMTDDAFYTMDLDFF